MLILSIETATTVCSVALSENGKILELKEVNQPNVHASLLGVYIQEILTNNRTSVQNLDAIAVSKGPGSYTGLRIGVSTAKGLCFAHDKPLISVNTLEAMSQGARKQYNDQEFLFAPMIDARRMEVYTAVFTQKGEQLKETSADIITEDSFTEYLQNNKVVFFGDGAEKCQQHLRHPNSIFDLALRPSAGNIAELASGYFTEKRFEDVAYFEPFYLKDFLAGPKKGTQ